MGDYVAASFSWNSFEMFIMVGYGFKKYHKKYYVQPSDNVLCLLDEKKYEEM